MNELEYIELAAWRLVSQLKAVARTATEKAIIDAFEQFAREIARCREIQIKMADGKLKREVQQKTSLVAKNVGRRSLVSLPKRRIRAHRKFQGRTSQVLP
jgi:hypothetical protein